MTRTALCGAIFSAALAVGVSAQTGYPAQDKPQDKAQAPKADTVTVTGCLAPADSATAPSPTGTSGTAPKAEGYILKNVSASPSASGAAGTSGGAIPSQVELTGGSKADLKKFENSKVEIKGKIEESKSPMSSPSAAASAALPRLHVDSIKQISASCSN
jgi:hypothetical protein